MTNNTFPVTPTGAFIGAANPGPVCPVDPVGPVAPCKPLGPGGPGIGSIQQCSVLYDLFAK